MPDLEGLLVVSLEQAVAAPYASRLLADAGARVLKIERPEGDFARRYDTLVHGESAYFVWLNRGKESVCLDLRTKPDLDLLLAMIAAADVFIQNLAPGSAARLGLDGAVLRRRNPKLIACSISGYGEDGPYRDQKAYDLLVQAESGLLAINGTPEESARVGVSICDIAAGMTAHAAILQALVARARTDEGRSIEVSLFHSIADWMNVPYLQTRYGKSPPPRVGVKHPTIAPYGAFRCGDGKYVVLAIQNEREWDRLCRDVLGSPSLATDPRFATNVARVANRDELDALLAMEIGRVTREAAITRLGAAGIACGRLSDMDDVLVHPQQRLIVVASSGGRIEMLAPGARTGGDPATYGAIPGLGQHTADVRREFSK
jgi:crotonobetainyl-CoA:carnitine CoA-transferase CaiB-like acyl-CoA transferase